MEKLAISNKTEGAIEIKSQILPKIAEKIATASSFFDGLGIPCEMTVKISKKKFKPSWGIYDSGYYTLGFSENVSEINGKIGTKLIEKFYQSSIEDYKKTQEAENLRRAKSNWNAEMNAALDK